MTKPITVTIPVEFEVKELLELWGPEFVQRKKFYKIAQSDEFKQEMAKLLREDFVAQGAFDDLDFFTEAMSDDCFG